MTANYSENKETALLTVDQCRWMDLKGRIKLAQPLRTPPRLENSEFCSSVFDITQNKLFKKNLWSYSSYSIVHYFTNHGKPMNKSHKFQR